MQHRRQIILDNLAITIFTSIPFLSRHPPLGSLFAMYCYYFDLHPFSIYLVFVFLRSRRQRPGGAAPTDRRINFLSPSSTSRLSNSLYPSPPSPRSPTQPPSASAGSFFERVKRSHGIVSITIDASRFVDSLRGDRFSTCNWHLHRREYVPRGGKIASRFHFCQE